MKRIPVRWFQVWSLFTLSDMWKFNRYFNVDLGSPVAPQTFASALVAINYSPSTAALHHQANNHCSPIFRRKLPILCSFDFSTIPRSIRRSEKFRNRRKNCIDGQCCLRIETLKRDPVPLRVSAAKRNSLCPRAKKPRSSNCRFVWFLLSKFFILTLFELG